MPNYSKRKFCNSKTYHIIFKGIDNQNIFYEDQDRRVFLNQLLKTKKKFTYNIYSYCLMDNHVHMVIKIEDIFLSKAMQSLLIMYVHYFNNKYKRIGPLMQDRFKSKSIENQLYFLRVCRYVHNNPQSAGISKIEDYEWSSYKEYLGKENIIDKKSLLHYFNYDLNEFIKFNKEYNINEINAFSDYEMVDKLTDEQLLEIIMKRFQIDLISNIPVFFKQQNVLEFEKIVKEMKNIAGTNKTQLARVTRIGRKVIERIWHQP